MIKDIYNTENNIISRSWFSIYRSSTDSGGILTHDKNIIVFDLPIWIIIEDCIFECSKNTCITKLLGNIVNNISSNKALELILILKKFWDVNCKSQYCDIHLIIKDLIDATTLAEWMDSRMEFKENDYICDMADNNMDKLEKERIYRWFNSSKYYNISVLIDSAFSCFGIKTLEKLYHDNQDINKAIKADKSEASAILLLHEITEKNFGNMFCINIFDSCSFFKTDNNIAGTAVGIPYISYRFNSLGICSRMNVKHIYLSYLLLDKNMFYKAVATYIHELLHEFGDDYSTNFRKCLLGCIEVSLHTDLSREQDKWIQILSEETQN